MVVFEAGKATWITRPGGNPGSPVTPGSTLKTGSVIETSPDSNGDIRLGCGSLVRAAPGTRIKVMPFSLGLESGAILTRHTGSFFPMKVQGGATLIISKDSVVDMERDKDGLVAQVLTGKMKTPGIPKYLVPGQSIETIGNKAVFSGRIPKSRNWDSPRLGDFGAPISFPDEIFSEETFEIPTAPSSDIQSGGSPPTSGSDDTQPSPQEDVQAPNLPGPSPDTQTQGGQSGDSSTLAGDDDKQAIPVSP